jgi:hypothetical protein
VLTISRKVDECKPLTLGTNDAALADVEPAAHVPLEEYALNLAAIVRHLQVVPARYFPPRHVIQLTLNSRLLN